MSPIGRVFIVINLVLAVCFLAFAAFYLKNHDHYRTLYTQEKSAKASLEKELNGKLAAAESGLESTKNDLSVKVQEIGNKNTQLTAAEERNTTLQGQVNDLQTKLSSIDASMSTVSSTLEKQNTSLNDLTEKRLAAEKAARDAIGARDDAIDKLRLAEASLKKSAAREQALAAEVAEKASDLRKARLTLAVIKEKAPGVMDLVAGGALPAVEGTIMDVDPSLKTVAITLGENQAGAKVGWKLAVHDGTTYKGEIVLTNVSDNMGYGRIVNAVPGTTIQKQDKATTRLR